MQVEFNAKVKGMPVVAVAFFYSGELDGIQLEVKRSNGYRRATWLERAMSNDDQARLKEAAYSEYDDAREDCGL